VTDDHGRCVGVLSATDFMRWAEGGRPRGNTSESHSCFCSSWQILETETLPDEPVSRYMTPDPVTVVPATAVGRLAQMMLDAHIHRLIVVDKNHNPVGIVSSTDVLSALARADQDWQARLEKKPQKACAS
jgi:CBS domain-containing protein